MRIFDRKLLPILAALAATIGLAIPAATAQQDVSREVLPIPQAPFSGTVGENVLDAVPAPLRKIRPPAGAPNILVFMSDDVGFAMSSTFGGPVPTPTFDQLARKGVRYNRFHTTGVCSPSRASLLTGRNHHNAGVGYLSDLPNGFPGYGGKILPSTATMAEVLKLNGYNTAMFGKHHNVPTSERSAAGPFDSWPTGMGFEYFFGFIAGDTDQFEPNLYRGIQRVDPDAGDGSILEKRIADDIIHWLHNQNAGDPDKPWLIYLSPASTHAPHQVPEDWVDRFRGRFDHGWDAERERIFQRQLASGIVPPGTVLTERPEAIHAWDTLDPKQKAFAARSMEVAAAQLAYQDAQLGRVIDELDRMGELDNTLIVIVGGDNGADAAAGNDGTINELRHIGNPGESSEFLYSNIDKLGGPDTYGNYPSGWAWAMNTPLRWSKHHSSMLGGIRNGMIMFWPGRVEAPGSVCGRFSHVNDIMPTVLEAASLPAPVSVLGTRQKPMDGSSLLDSLQACDPDRPRTQYFEVGGQYGLYHNGWFLSGDNQRLSWQYLPPGGARPDIVLGLYDLTSDWSQSRDVSAQNPQQFAAMQALWQREAEANGVFPLDHRFADARARTLAANQPSGRQRFEYWGKNVSVPANLEPRLSGRPLKVTARIARSTPDASGVILASGSKFGGWSLYLDRGRPAFAWAGSTDPAEMASGIADEALPADVDSITMRLEMTQRGGPGIIVVEAGGREYLRLTVPSNAIRPAGGGETFDIGRDTGVAVTDYPTPRGAFEGEIPHLVVSYDW